jgi:predicted O-methyltransferase YrrM
LKTLSIVSPWSGSTADLLADFDAATIGAQLIIVDNASDEATAAALQTLPADRGVVIRNATNAGFAAGNNQGYAHASGDVIIFLNSDIAGDPAWLRLVADDVQDGALYGPALGRQLVGGRWLPYLEGWCIAATRATWEQLKWEVQGWFSGEPYMSTIGPWDDLDYPGPYWEDNDLCFRALQAGIALVQTQWTIQHKGGRTAGPLMRHAASFERNRQTFTARVQAAETPSVSTPTYAAYQQHVHTPSDIQHHLPLLYSLARGNVLELGTRSGVSTAALLAGVEAHGGHVWSVDIDERSAKVAEGHPLWTFMCCDSRNGNGVWSGIRRQHPDDPVDRFDLILIDTEHTLDMASAELSVWGDFLAPGGTICMHDPETFPGVRRAATEFAAARGWPITFVLPCNGMAVIERPNDG